MLYEEKLTIEGVRRKLNKVLNEPMKAQAQVSQTPVSPEDIKKELLDILNILKDK